MELQMQASKPWLSRLLRFVFEPTTEGVNMSPKAAPEAGVETSEPPAPPTEAEIEGAAEDAGVLIEGGVVPPFFTVEHSDGQNSIIPVDFSCVVQIIDPFGAIKATVGLSGVAGFELVL